MEYHIIKQEATWIILQLTLKFYDRWWHIEFRIEGTKC